MIRKLKSGEYRLYSKKKNPKVENAGTWELFKSGEAAQKSTSVLFNISSIIKMTREKEIRVRTLTEV